MWRDLLSCVLVLVLPLTGVAAETRAIGVVPDGTWLRKDDVSHVGNYYGLVIAVDRYGPEEWRLRTAVADGKAIAKLLREAYGFKEVVELYNDAATLTAMKRALAKLAEKVTPRDSVLIYYAGHGKLVGGTGYWIPADGKPREDWGWLEHIVVRDRIKIARFKARHVLVVSDSCYAAALFRDATVPAKVAPEYVQKALKTPSRQCLTSGGLAPVADGGGGRHSVFAKYFLKCLQRPPRDVFVPSDIMADLKTNVGDNAPKIGGERQVPILGILTEAGGERLGEFVFIRRKDGVTTKRVPVPGTSGLDELRARLERLEAAKKAFETAMKIDAMDVPAKEKVAAWENYLKNFSAADYELAKARERVIYWLRWHQTALGIPEPASMPSGKTVPETENAPDDKATIVVLATLSRSDAYFTTDRIIGLIVSVDGEVVLRKYLFKENHLDIKHAVRLRPGMHTFEASWIMGDSSKRNLPRVQVNVPEHKSLTVGRRSLAPG